MLTPATKDSAGIQAAINAVTSGGDPDVAVRSATQGVYLPAGQYNIDAEITVHSLARLTLIGEGINTILNVPTGVTLNSVLDFDGFQFGDVGKFRIQTTGTGEVVDAIRYRKSANVFATSQRNRFTNIQIATAAKFQHGFAIQRVDSGSNQVDTTSYYNVYVSGAWESGEATYWQSAFALGDGTQGNVLLHHFYACDARSCRYNIYARGPSYGWYGGQLANAEADINHQSSTTSLVQGVRSEGSERLLISGGVSNANHMLALRDIQWHGGSLNADGKVIDYLRSGTLRLENINLLTPPVGVDFIIGLESTTGHLNVIAEGIVSPEPVASLFSLGSAVSLQRKGIVQWESGAFQEESNFAPETLGVPNSAAATSLGSVTKKIEVFDEDGVSLGFLPVYDAIT